MRNSNLWFSGWILADLLLIMVIIFLISSPAQSVRQSVFNEMKTDLEQQLSEKIDQLEDAEKKLTLLKNENDSLKLEITTLQSEILMLQEELRDLKSCRQEVDFRFDQIIFPKVSLKQYENVTIYDPYPVTSLDSTMSIFLDLDQAMTTKSERELDNLQIARYEGSLINYFQSKSEEGYNIALIQTYGYANKLERDQGNMTTRARKVNTTLIPELRGANGKFNSLNLLISANTDLNYDGWFTALYSGLIEPDTVRANIYYVKSLQGCETD